MELEQIEPGRRLAGVVPGQVVEILGVRRTGAGAATVTFERTDGSLAQVILFRADEPRLRPEDAAGRPFDADGRDFRLAAEAQRIRLAGLFDPMLAVATSAVDPLPHQIRAVYGEMLPRHPLRFLLADDPGAGKTIMAGLLIKELLLREDVRRALVVAPGGLVDQWQDELWFKFGLDFRPITTSTADAALGTPALDAHPLLIGRMDQLARRDDLLAQLTESQWDLVVVDEAHRMSAHYFGGKLQRSKRFQLGEVLSARTRHLLLMTATPHAGKDEDFRLFLSLLDRDRFEGRSRSRVGPAETSTLMRRMVKEDLLTFDGLPLFPDRRATTVRYALSAREQDLYDQVTRYVREEMNRAQHLDGRQRTTVGFALTVLQRRLASSPEAIYRSLARRAERLQRRRQDLVTGVGVSTTTLDDAALLDEDEYSAQELEQVEEELLDSATAARTVVELDAELVSLHGLIEVARAVRALDTDRKWTELRQVLESNVIGVGPAARPHKLIVFTEHRDTLTYLHGRISAVLGRADGVQAIHGGVSRRERRRITEEFTHNPQCQVLLATDAAGEGLNLQCAHLMVNYDLPWNPNRLEQRFGRIHRIGQTEVCHLWNLLADGTREGEVFGRLLEKVEAQRQAYGGRVFDVLGAAFAGRPLRDLLVEAIRYGEQPEVQARMHRVIDDTVSVGLPELLNERALAHDSMAEGDVDALRRQLEEARARGLQPHYIAECFVTAFRALRGRISQREAGRYEIGNVPAEIRQVAAGPVATRYERVTFDLDRIAADGLPRADLLAPGHALHDAVLTRLLGTIGDALHRGAVLTSPQVAEPCLLVGVIEQVVDGTGDTVGKRFGYAVATAAGDVSDAGPAPYLDCSPATDAIAEATVRGLRDVEQRAVDWLVDHSLPSYLAEVAARREVEVRRTREQVTQRMTLEINRLAGEAMEAAAKERAGTRVRESSESLDRKAADLEVRLRARLDLLERQGRLAPVPPRVVAAAIVLPAAVEPDTDPVRHGVDTAEVDRRAVAAVLAAERALGRHPTEMAHSNPGYDVRSVRGDEPTVFIEVKGRIAGATDFFISHSQVRHGQNTAPHFRLALVRVDPRGPEHDTVRYLDQPFHDLRLGSFDAVGVTGNWATTWARGRAPF